ncbi:MAG: ATP-binding protein [Nitrospirae bacterium]|nr:ATP-binding protein [Nitrospirota bacterium]
MIKRTLQDRLIRSLRNFPVVGIVGPRQTGKTTLAKQIAGSHRGKVIYLDLELPSDMNRLSDAELFLSSRQDSLVIIDEIQRMPSLFPLLRALVDKKRRNGRFLILGSASPDVIKNASESLAGRVAYHELAQFSLSETGDKSLKKLWIRGGYPLSYLAKSDSLSFAWREAFIKTYLEMDIPQLGIRVPAGQLRRFWMMVAHMHGQLWNASAVGRGLGVSPVAVKHYLDILESTFIVRQLVPYFHNAKKRLVKAPKVYIRDSGLLHLLLNVRTDDELHGHPAIGSSWEGFVIGQILAIMPESWQHFFYRTAVGAEIDLLLIGPKGRKVGVEIKYSLSPRPAKGFWIAMDELKCSKGFVVYPGEEGFPLADKTKVIPVSALTEIFR